jgi:hypothetical protein
MLYALCAALASLAGIYWKNEPVLYTIMLLWIF